MTTPLPAADDALRKSPSEREARVHIWTIEDHLSNQSLNFQRQPFLKGGADMKLKLFGMMVLGCAVAAAAAIIPAEAQAERQATNPAVRMAIVQSVADPTPDYRSPADAPAFLHLQADAPPDRSFTLQTPPMRFIDTVAEDDRPLSDTIRSLDVEFALQGTTQNGIDIEIAPRAGIALGPDGRTGAGAGAEFRVGQGLSRMVRAFEGGDTPSWYFFAATDGSALTWRPDTADAAIRGLRFQEERVVVGDAQIGVSTEFRGMQASLSVVNREISNGKDSVDQNFVGATFTWRR